MSGYSPINMQWRFVPGGERPSRVPNQARPVALCEQDRLNGELTIKNAMAVAPLPQ